MSLSVPTNRVVTFLFAYHKLQDSSFLMLIEASPWKVNIESEELSLQSEILVLQILLLLCESRHDLSLWKAQAFLV